MSNALQVLVDADNVPVARIRALLHAVEELDVERRVVVAGHPTTLKQSPWPADAYVIAAEGWQGADVALASAYTPTPGPLVLVSGDADFVSLVTRHPGPVLVVSEAAASRNRDIATVVDPVIDDIRAIGEWLRGAVHE